MTKDEALKMAIEFIDEITNAAGKYPYVDKTSLVADSYAMASKLKEALEQPAQEPVGWMDSEGRFRLDFRTEIVRNIAAVNKEIPLYTHPAPSWQGLSDDEIAVIIGNGAFYELGDLEFARAIEQALKEKNT